MSRPLRWSPLQILIYIILKCGTTNPMLASEETTSPKIIVAASHTALSGDLGVVIIEFPSEFQTSSTQTTVSTTTKYVEADSGEDEEDYSFENNQISLQDPFVLRVLRLDGFSSELVGEVPVEVPAVFGVNVSLMIPCGLFSRGGTYSLQLQHKSAPVLDQFTDATRTHDAQMRASLDVRWPTASLAVEPQHLDTYPSQPVLATLEYGGVSCEPETGVPAPTYSLQLIYCGTSVLSCDPRNKSHVQMLYSEEVKGFPAQRVITLRCEFFGLAGHYALRLKPSDDNPSAPTTSAYIKVEWSDLFVFNVHARSIYPCDPGGGGGGGGGISVLFEYPSCRLPGDRVRLYGRLRADVASLAPPSSLHYVAELKAPIGKHTLTFDCELFTERYVEYCFVYISQAYNGAMSEVRVDCVPTFPVQETDAGGWGQWSQWTPCSSSCVGGTRNRHRFCDTPPPRYGAKFCQGEAVETEACGGSSQLDLRGELSPGDWECRHGEGLAADRPEVTAEVGAKCRCGCSLNIDSEQQRKIIAASSRVCPGRSFWLVQTNASHVLKLYLDQARLTCSGQYVRVRDGDSLIDELLADFGPDRREPASGQLRSTGPRLLLEFFSEEASSTLAAAAEDASSTSSNDSACLAGFLAHVTIVPRPAPVENVTTATPALLLDPKVMAAIGRWAVWMTPAHVVAASLLAITFLASIFLGLQYAYRYRKYQIAEDLESLTDNSACSGSMQAITRRKRAPSSSTLVSEVVSLVRLPRRHSLKHARLDEMTADVEEGYESTETQADGDDGEDDDDDEDEEEEEEEEDDEEEEEDESGSEVSATGTLRPDDEDQHLDKQQQQQQQQLGSQRTIVGSAGSVPSTPSARRSSASSAATAARLAISGAQQQPAQAEVKYARPVELPTFGQVSPVSEEATSTSENGRRFSDTSTSISLNNGISPASSSSNSTLRRCSGKESKERRNRERLGMMQGAGSEFSLAKDEDLELDYYDYNVVNAAAAPGSYLGMDPAFLVWIPPFDPDADPDSSLPEEPHYEEIPERIQGDEPIESSSSGGRPLSKLLDSGDCRLHDEIIQEYKARLSEGALPGQPFRDADTPDSGASQQKRRSKRIKKRRRVQKKGPSECVVDELSPSEVNDLDTPRARRRLATELNATPTTTNGPSESLALSEIQKQPPAKPPRKSQIEPRNDDCASKKQSLLYEYIAGAADAIKFADEDEDEPYVDNKAAA